MQVQIELWHEIARIAELRGTSMVEVVTDAVRRLTRDEGWSSVRSELDAMTPAEAAAYQTEGRRFDAASADGLRDR